MQEKNRNNLAIYTLAGSILLSSVIFSMNQSNAHTTDSRKISDLASCVNSNWQKISFAIMDLEMSGRGYFIKRNC
jgi:hypothetical protein